MSVRRNAIMNLLANAFKWLPYSFEYINNSLIPTTISGKNVKNKLRFAKIYANGGIVNQLVQNGNFADTSSWSAFGGTLSILNNVGTITLNSAGSANRFQQNITPIANHKYLVKFDIKSSNVSQGYLHFGDNYSDNAWDIDTTWTTKTFLLTPTQTTNVFRIYINYGGHYLSNNDKVDLRNVKIFNLTQSNINATTVDEARTELAKLGINIDEYNEFDSGSYRGTDISEVSSEPYNLFDGELEGGSIQQSSGQNVENPYAFRTKNYTKVVAGRTYTFENSLTQLGTLYLRYYDISYNYIGYETGTNTNTQNITIPNNVVYIRAYWYRANTDWGTNPPSQNEAQVCVHLQGTRTGYAPHKTFSPIALKYQGNGVINSHDTLEITDTEWVFTKNNGVVDLGSLNWASGSSTNTHCFQASGFSGFKTFNSNEKANILCAKYITDTSNVVYAGSADKTISISSVLRINDSAYDSTTDLATFKTAMSGVMLYYELATPQVITIPRKHLGVVDLGSLNWTFNQPTTARQYFTSTNLVGIVKNAINNNTKANIYCSKYTTQIANYANGYSDTSYNLVIAIDGNGTVVIKDTNFTDTTAFKQAMQGVYLFYETTDEVEEMPFEIEVESGGTITTDSEVKPNADVLLKCK